MADEVPILSDGAPLAAVKSKPDGGYSPAVPSPLNPDSSKRPIAKPVAREQREKKESLKKRESAVGGTAVRNATPEQKAVVVKPSAKSKTKSGTGATLAPQRYPLQTPPPQAFQPSVSHGWASHEPTRLLTPDGRTELKRALDCAQNTKIYKYSLAMADPLFRHKQWYRGTEAAPYGPQFSAEDSDKLIHFNEAKRVCTNERGWRTSRANVFAREGSHYYEVKIAKGVPIEGPAVPAGSEMIPQPHIRMGWTRREAPLDAPVGFDGYSYGITDIRFQTIHKSRPGKIAAPVTGKPSKPKSKTKAALSIAASSANQRPSKIEDDTGEEDHVREGDVIGLLITLPSLSLQKKVAEGIYNPAVDVGDGFDAEDAHSLSHDIIRDRIPVQHRGNYYFEQIDYQISKSMESYGERGPNNIVRPNTNHEDPVLRCLPHSSVKIWKNGVLQGTAFENLMSFLPPASEMPKGQMVPLANGGKGGVSVDDGTLGYYPAVSSFAGGIAEVNFGPDFWYPPTELAAEQPPVRGEDTIMADGPSIAHRVPMFQTGSIPSADDVTNERQAAEKRQAKPLSQRYPEQIAEDIVWDIVDEASFFAEDGGYDYTPPRETGRGSKSSAAGMSSGMANGYVGSSLIKEESAN